MLERSTAGAVGKAGCDWLLPICENGRNLFHIQDPTTLTVNVLQQLWREGTCLSILFSTDHILWSSTD